MNNTYSYMYTSFDGPEYDEAYFYDQLSELADFFVKDKNDDDYFTFYANRIMHGVKGLIARLSESEVARFDINNK